MKTLSLSYICILTCIYTVPCAQPQVEEIVPTGSLDPDFVHVPSVFVHRIYKADKLEKRIEVGRQ